jgi:hypothetical protein
MDEDQYSEDLRRLCYAQREFEKINPVWNLDQFQQWLNDNWGVHWLEQAEFPGPYIQVLDQDKYIFFVLKFPSHYTDELD